MKIVEIVNSDGELIGANSTPESGSDLDTVAKGTTDNNIKIAHQPYRYDMMARFGFLGMPFYENKEGEQDKVIAEIDQFLYKNKMAMLEYYYKNPNKLKADFRHQKDKKLNELSESTRKNIEEITDGVLSAVEKFLKEAFEKKNINEIAVVEDKVVEKKSEDEISKKSEDNDIRNKSINNIADLIAKKLDKSEINKLITLLENE
jgi:hypothetical protein